MSPDRFAEIGENPTIFEPVTLGFRYRDDCAAARIGAHCLLRPGVTIYADVEIGDYFKAGHDVLIRAHTCIGNRVTIANRAIVEGRTTIGDGCRIMSMVYIPTQTKIGRNVFIGPSTCFTNAKYPMRGPEGDSISGVVIEDHVCIGGNVTLVAGVRVGEGAFIGAGAIVHRDVPAWTLAVGAPVRFRSLPDELREINDPESMGRHMDLWCPWDADTSPPWTAADVGGEGFPGGGNSFPSAARNNEE